MSDELQVLLDTAIRKEFEAKSIYIAAREKTQNAALKGLLKGLAEEEDQHMKRIGDLKVKYSGSSDWIEKKVIELQNTELVSSEAIPEDDGIEEVLIKAIEQEQMAIDFYSRMVSALNGREAKSACEELAHDELKHKVKLELIYKDLYL